MANLHGSIDPVAWQNPLHPDQLSSKPIPNWMPLYTAAPAAQQYEAGDMASAAAQGFRDGVASAPQQAEPVRWERKNDAGEWVGVPHGDEHFWAKHGSEMRTKTAHQQAEAVPSSDLNPDEGDPVTLWAEIWRLREAVKGPDGYATWQDAATAERIRRVRAESKQAEEAKAVPTHDDTDLIKQMLEALRSCSGVPHWPALIPTINAARKRLETPQQAEAVPPDVVRDADVEAAAKKMAEIFDYPWDFMPEKGRNTMRENVRAVLTAAQGEKP